MSTSETLPLVRPGTRGTADADEKARRDATASITADIDALGITRFHVLAVVICGLANAADAVELLCVSFIVPSLGSIDETSKAALAASVFVGMLAGGLVVGALSDTLGRKRLLIAALAINAGFGALSAATNTWGQLAACRVVAGFGVGASIPGVFSLMTEYLPTKRTGVFISIIAWHWMVGTLYAAGLAYVLIGRAHLSWRWFAVGCAVPAACACVLIGLLLPESPRFLATRNRMREARAALAWMRSISGKTQAVALDDSPRVGDPAAEEDDVPLVPMHPPTSPIRSVQPFWSRVISAIRSMCSCCAVGAQCSDQPISKCRSAHVVTTVCMLFDRARRRDTALLMGVWFCLSFGWYGLVLWVPTLFDAVDFKLDIYQDSLFVAAANLPGNMLATFLMDRVPKPWLLAGSLFLACACAIAFGFGKNEAMVVTAACLMNAISVCSWNSLDVLSVDRFPTHLRSSAMGVLSACGRLGSIVGQFVFGAMLNVSIPGLLGLAGAVLFSGGGFALLLPREAPAEAADFVPPAAEGPLPGSKDTVEAVDVESSGVSVAEGPVR